MKTTKEKMADAIGIAVQQYEQHIQDNAKAEDIADIAAQAALDVVCEELEHMATSLGFTASKINKGIGQIQSFTIKAAADRLRG